MPYHEWATKEAGVQFPMDVAPTFKATVNLPAPTPEDPSKFEDQAADFAEMINRNNQGGRNVVEAKSDAVAKNQAEALANEEKETYVVESVLSTVINRPVSSIDISTEKFAKEVIPSVDDDHAHFRISGKMAINALDQNHIGGRLIKPDQAYLLSVIDFREYSCAFLKNSIRDYFARKSNQGEKRKLYKESIYMVSDLEVSKAVAGNVQPAEIAAVEKFAGKRPDLVLSQTVLYSDHLIRGGRNTFAFFGEGNQTRIVLISNLGMGRKFFTGTLGKQIRTKIMEGIGTKTAIAGQLYYEPKKVLGDLLSGSTQDLAKKNACNVGLAQGLPAYSKQLFAKFATYMSKN
jgi:hypothetical protein